MVDVESFLEPIREERPTGDNVRTVSGDTTIDVIQELREEEDPALAIGTPKVADWRAVRSTCEEVLRSRSKDLEIAALLTESWTRLEGVSGLRDGLRLIAALLARYWEDLHPGMDTGPDGPEILLPVRARPLTWMGSTDDFMNSVKSVQITSSGAAWADYEQAELVDQTGTKNRARYDEMVAAGMLTGEQWREAVGATPLEELGAVLEGIRACRTALTDLQGLCQDKFKDEEPNLNPLRDLLEEMQTYLERSVGGDSTTGSGDGGATNAPRASGPSTEEGPIASRDAALRRLREVADYLRTTEPHSPTSYLIERAVKWGQMPFEDLMKDVLKDDEVLGKLRDLLGIPPAAE